MQLFTTLSASTQLVLVLADPQQTLVRLQQLSKLLGVEVVVVRRMVLRGGGGLLMMSDRVLMSAVEALEQVKGARGRVKGGQRVGGLLMMSDRVLMSAVEALEQVKGGGGERMEGRGVEVVGSVIWF